MILPDSAISPTPQPAARKEVRGLLLAIYHLVSMISLFGAAALLALSALVAATARLPGMEEAVSLMPAVLMAAGMVFCGILLIPPTIQAFRQMGGKPDLPVALPPLRVWNLLSVLAIWLTAALTAQFLGQSSASWLILPPLTILGIGLPIYLLFRLGTGGLRLESRQRAWNIFGLGMTAGPLLAGVLETAAYLILLLGGTLALALNPDWQAVSQQVAADLEKAASMDQILAAVSPYLRNPVVVVLLLLAVAVFIPLTEELVKPAGIWLLRKNLPAPQEGFALGVISGAGFALLESLMAAASSDGEWGMAFLARVGGGVMHMLNTGLMGWAIASFWRERRFGRLAGTYGLVVLLHGLWNALTVLTVLGGLQVIASSSQADLLGGGMMLVSLLGLGGLALGGLAALILFNRRMQPAKAVEMPESTDQPR